jgi:mercuric ion transport protein
MSEPMPKSGLGIVGVGAVACAACCAGPILGFLAAIGLGTALGVAVFGVAGLGIALLAVVPIMRRRRQAAACEPPTSTAITLGRRSE